VGTAPRGSAASVFAGARAYFASDARRTIQSLLGLIWLIDGALQFQSFMYTQGFVHVIVGGAAGQPYWLASSIRWSAHVLGSSLTLLNTLSALTQVIIGLGFLCRPTVKGALALSIAWSLLVWWFAEAFGLLFSDTASPLTGAPGAVLLYAIIGLLVWPNERPGGLLGARGARMAWASLWLLAPNSSANATSIAIDAAPSGAASLANLQHSVATAVAGDGLLIAFILAGLSAAIGLTVAINWHPRAFLAAAIVLNLAYWVLGQGLGGVLTGSGTDPNSGPLFILFAIRLYSLLPARAAGDPIALRAPAVCGDGGTLPMSSDAVPAARGLAS
jgi:hypothetical protein